MLIGNELPYSSSGIRHESRTNWIHTAQYHFILPSIFLNTALIRARKKSQAMDFNTAHTLSLVKGVYMAILKILRNRFCQFEFVTLYNKLYTSNIYLLFSGLALTDPINNFRMTRDGKITARSKKEKPVPFKVSPKYGPKFKDKNY